MGNQTFETELLYFGHGHSTGTARHCHSYFQLEYCIEGQLSASSYEKKLVLNPGDYWLIPPGVVHKFNKNRNPLNYISIKFTSPAVSRPRSKIGCSPVGQYYLEKIRSILDGETAFNAYAHDGKSIIENYLSGFLRHLEQSGDKHPQSEFKTVLQRWICEFGAESNINDLAETFQLSRAEFKYRFQQEIGNGRIKEYIDSILLKIADQHLRYSDVPLNKIAYQLHFSSIYAFSRYYKHHRGITPSEFRRREAGSEKTEPIQTEK